MGRWGIFELHELFSLTFPLQEYFSVCKDIFSGLLAVHAFFSLTFPLFCTSNCAKFNEDCENGEDLSVRTSLNDKKKLSFPRT